MQLELARIARFAQWPVSATDSGEADPGAPASVFQSLQRSLSEIVV
jgi:hypothetical protein